MTLIRHTDINTEYWTGTEYMTLSRIDREITKLSGLDSSKEERKQRDKLLEIRRKHLVTNLPSQAELRRRFERFRQG